MKAESDVNKMYSIAKDEFRALAKKYNLIPLYREIVADADTPVSAFLKLGREKNSFLLESVEGGETLGRYSFIGIDPFLTVSGKDHRVTVTGEVNEAREGVADPLTVVEEFLGRYHQAPLTDLPPFLGGAVGYIGYDCVRYFEAIPRSGKDDLDLPDLHFVFADILVIFDHLKHSLKVLVNTRTDGDPGAAWGSAVDRIEGVIEKLKTPVAAAPII